MNDRSIKYLLMIISVLLLAGVIIGGLILWNVSGGSLKSANMAEAPMSVGNAPLPTSTVDAEDGAKDNGAAPAATVITGMNLSLMPGINASSSASDIATASQWLTSHGFTVNNSGPASISFSGPTSAIESAFGVQVHSYTMNGKNCYSGVPSTNVTIPVPKDLAASVGSIAMPNACVPLP